MDDENTLAELAASWKARAARIEQAALRAYDRGDRQQGHRFYAIATTLEGCASELVEVEPVEVECVHNLAHRATVGRLPHAWMRS